MATITSGPWPRAHLHSPAKTCYQARSVITFAPFMGDMTLGQGTFGTWSIQPSISMVDSVTRLRYAECSRAPDYINIGFLGRWGTYACPQCLPSDVVPIRSWTWTLRPSGIRHRHLPYHTIPYVIRNRRLNSVVLSAPLRSVQFSLAGARCAAYFPGST